MNTTAKSAIATLIDESSTTASELNVFDRLSQTQAQGAVEYIATFQHNVVIEGDLYLC